MRSRLAVLAATAALVAVAGSAAWGKVDIKHLTGSDLGFGVGPRAISMGGAFVGLADDITAVFWNPAGLVQLQANEAMLMFDAPDKFTFKGVALRPLLGRRDPWSLALAYSRTNRLTYDGEGDWSTDKRAGHLVDLSMINLPRNPDQSIDYVGGIDSRTNDERWTAAFTVPGRERISVGLSYVDFKCITTFYGAGAGRACQIVSYETMDLGVLYRTRAGRSLGLMMRNVVESSKPRYLAAGLALNKGARIFTVDVEHIFGHYEEVERRKANFLFLRAGTEAPWVRAWKLRFGIVVPVIAKTSTLGNLRSELPAPWFGGAVGAGYEDERFKFDLALYGDPAKSYIDNRPRFSLTMSGAVKF